MKKKSIWLENLKEYQCKSITNSMNVDVLIIGGGITGILALNQLKQTNLKTILVERNLCGHGVTSRSTAKITYLQEKIYYYLRKFRGEKIAKAYLESQIEAVKNFKKIIETEKIDCDFKPAHSYLFTNSHKNIKKLEREYQFLKKNGVKVTKGKEAPFTNDVSMAIQVPDTYVFHPLKFIQYFKNKYYDDIYENSKVTFIKKENDTYLCTINEYIIKAKYVIIATHYPSFLFPFMLPMKSHIETSYIGACNIDTYQNISAINIDKPTISFRYHEDEYKHYFIYLYGSYISSNLKNTKKYYEDLEEQYQFDYIWSNKDIITNDYLPYIGAIYKNDSTFLIACGYNTWGFTNAMLASILIKDIILKKDNQYIPLFSPNRSFNLSKFLRFPIDMGCNLKSFLKSTKWNVNNKSVIYKKINGKNVAIYTDKNGLEHIVLRRCPHMKCGLIFNEKELTWDCLCHGSRFDIDGKCIEGPSNLNISFKE